MICDFTSRFRWRKHDRATGQREFVMRKKSGFIENPHAGVVIDVADSVATRSETSLQDQHIARALRPRPWSSTTVSRSETESSGGERSGSADGDRAPVNKPIKSRNPRLADRILRSCILSLQTAWPFCPASARGRQAKSQLYPRGYLLLDCFFALAGWAADVLAAAFFFRATFLLALPLAFFAFFFLAGFAAGISSTHFPPW